MKIQSAIQQTLYSFCSSASPISLTHPKPGSRIPTLSKDLIAESTSEVSCDPDVLLFQINQEVLICE